MPGNPRRLAWSAVVIATVLGAPHGAHAWTEANVRTVHAHVELQPDGRARVAMLLTLQIHGGWLEGLELAELDPDLTLDETKPPWAVSATDPERKYEPTVRVRHGGRIELAFRGRGRSPRRGRLNIGLVYHTDLAHRATLGTDGGAVRVRWTLPGWRSGLDGVSVAVSAPAGTEPAGGHAEADASIEHDRVDAGDRTILRWRRAHLPRTVPWTLEVDVPEDAMDPSLRSVAPIGARKMRTEAARPTPIGVIVLVALLALFVLASRQSFRAAALRRGTRPRGVIPLPMFVCVPLAVAGAAATAWLWTDRPELALALLYATALLGVDRTARPADAPTDPCAPMRSRPADAVDTRRATRSILGERLGLATLFDLTTPLGLAALVGGAYAVLFTFELTAEEVPALPLALPALALPFLGGTRLHLPASMHHHLRALGSVAGRLRTSTRSGAVGLARRVYLDAEGAPQRCRLRLIPEGAPDGLLGLDLAFEEHADMGGFRRELVLIAVAVQGSPADTTLAGALGWEWKHVTDERATRVARVRGDASCFLEPLLEALRREASKPALRARLPAEPAAAAAAA